MAVTEPEQAKNPTGEATRQRIMDAAYQTLKKDGIKGASARAIARAGDFNQALIFYHFGSVNQLLVNAAQESSRRQVERYRGRVEGITELNELVQVAAQLHAEDVDEGSITVVAQLMAGAVHDDEMGRAIMDSFEPWVELVESALRKVFESSPLGPLMPIKDMAFGISALFLGVELMTKLAPGRLDEDNIFAMMGLVSGMVENVLAGGTVFGPADD